ncbi:ferredoxin [Candidatus Woesearchaeota archaeon]|nr:ferredoxin [Candidatus Woesearchaeota archaeon]
MAKIEFNKEACIGCGACAAVCPDNWEMEGDKAKCKNLNPEEAGCNQEAADSCPVECIKVIS